MIAARARSELTIAVASRQSSEGIFDGLLNGLSSLLSGASEAEIEREAVELLGIHQQVKNIDELKRVIADVRTSGGRFASFSNVAWRRRGKLWRILWITGAVVIPGIATFLVPEIRGAFHWLGKVVAGLLGELVVTAVWVGAGARAVSKHLDTLIRWEKKAEAARLSKEQTPEVIAAKQKVSMATIAENAAEVRLAEASAREGVTRRGAEFGSKPAFGSIDREESTFGRLQRATRLSHTCSS